MLQSSGEANAEFLQSRENATVDLIVIGFIKDAS